MSEIYKHPVDYNEFIRQIDEDDNDEWELLGEENDDQGQDDDSDGNDSSNNGDNNDSSTLSWSTPTSPPTPTNTSNEAESRNPTSDSWPSTPNNSPESTSSRKASRIPTRLSNPIDASSLTGALEQTINELQKFNETHPYPPIRRSGRSNLYQGSYNYNYTKRKAGR